MTKESTPRFGFDVAALSDAERILLAGELLDMIISPLPPLSAAQIAELEQYDAEADAGVVRGEPWGVVKARLKALG